MRPVKSFPRKLTLSAVTSRARERVTGTWQGAAAATVAGAVIGAYAGGIVVGVALALAGVGVVAAIAVVYESLRRTCGWRSEAREGEFGFMLVHHSLGSTVHRARCFVKSPSGAYFELEGRMIAMRAWLGLLPSEAESGVYAVRWYTTADDADEVEVSRARIDPCFRPDGRRAQHHPPPDE